MMMDFAPWTDLMGLAASVARTAIRHPPAGKAENPKVKEVIRENVIPAKEQDT